jgi:hypothetical protein
MRHNFVAFDDLELKSWLLELIADPSPGFLGALAEAVLTANREEYAVVRPCLIRLKEKYRRGAKKTPIHRERPAQHNTLAAMPDRSRASLKRVALESTDYAPEIYRNRNSDATSHHLCDSVVTAPHQTIPIEPSKTKCFRFSTEGFGGVGTPHAGPNIRSKDRCSS